jgi:hypothetical protein
MDCESFERVVLDRLYLELDELSMGAAQRHVAHCSRCRGIEVGLKATREVCRLPLLSPSDEFKDCVISIERQIHAVLPMRQRASRAVSVLAGYAMRPQPTMAALLLLMIGASLFLVRARPPERDLVQVTERGVPEGEADTLQLKARTIAGPAAAENVPNGMTNSADAAIFATPIDVNCGRGGNAGCASPGGSDPGAPSAKVREMQGLDAELKTARQLRLTLGCAAAIQSFESIRLRQPKSDAGLAATWDAAECYAKLHRKDEARTLLNTLAASPEYSKRANGQLEVLGEM